ncbi:DUF3142 domain-containing protein [Pseudomonas trivialis]|uniref:DUF3142 domain-containing protein n=1 Tax=Pseudomonas trivialis TaxID=200450 RepID=A0A0R2ZBH4_9PSED|nr:DUF3142 domain-containing protein [Pseudomonas trivialis]KRP58143.1 hypothetical protein TU79_21850 [Pseudomonas trivialis]SDS11955.1 Protein of unknown function [Pseudomonas trivialis]
MNHLWLGLLLLASPAFGAVDARDYDAFWLWSGVTPQPVLKQAKTLYILQGQINATRRTPTVRLIAQGMSVPRITQGEVWIVYRVHTLHWPERVYAQLLGQVQRWRDAGNPVVGIQIDFDARTQYLHEYAEFLRDLRQRLPADLRLSITGLMDWGSNADPAAIAQLKGVVDEVVVQTYQGRHSIPDYAAYLPRVSRMGVPFKVGLIQGGEWQAPAYLRESEWFGGYVVFLRNP